MFKDTDKKETIINMLVSGITLLPLFKPNTEPVTVLAGAGIVLIDGIHKLIKDKHKADQILDQIQSEIHCHGLSEEDIKSICFATSSALIRRKDTIRETFHDELLLQELKDEIFEGSDKRHDVKDDYKKYISEVVNYIGNPEILSVLLNCDQVSADNLNDIRCILNKLNIIDERVVTLEETSDDHWKMINDHEKRIETLEQNGTSNKSNTTDNQSYLENFKNELFLEADGSDVTLKNMYVSPHIESTGDSAARFIMNWFETNRRQPCMLLYGTAGVGKSSLISKIIADTNGETDEKEVEFKISKDDVLVCTLRKLSNVQLMASDSEEQILKMFGGYSLDQLKTKLLVLDGLDELCVMNKSFEGSEFLSNMSKLENGFHVLVTSREADYYFKEPVNNKRIVIERLRWTENEIKIWCDKYCLYNSNRNNWCSSFTTEFDNLDKDDNRRDIFCTPIILYICGYSETLLSDHHSVGSIYNNAFINILCREHQTGQSGLSKLTTSERESNLIAWQYTKELAYQMFLIDSLDLVKSDDVDNMRAKGIKNAEKMAIKFCKKNYDIEADIRDIDIKRELALCPFTKENVSGGITFAHKTVYEYFTAVKIYEDYLSKYNNNYFQDKDLDDVARDVMINLIEAYRYQLVTNEIFTFIINMKSVSFSLETDSAPDDNSSFNFKEFYNAFRHGMEQNLLARIGIPPAEDEYLYADNRINDYCFHSCEPLINKSINIQISLALTNTLNYFAHYFEKEIGYNELSDYPKIKGFEIGNLLAGYTDYINFNGWDFEGINLRYANLEKIYLNNVHLSYANMEGINLNNAYIDESEGVKANLEGAFLKGAHISSTILNIANMDGVNLENAWLNDVELHKAQMKKAKMNNVTIIRSDLRRTNLLMTHLENSILSNTELYAANMTKVYLKGSKLNNVSLVGAILDEANLQETEMNDVDLNSSWMIDATLDKAKLRNVNLKGAHLEGVSLCGTNMKQVDLEGAKLKDAIYNQHTVFPKGFPEEEKIKMQYIPDED